MTSECNIMKLMVCPNMMLVMMIYILLWLSVTQTCNIYHHNILTQTDQSNSTTLELTSSSITIIRIYVRVHTGHPRPDIIYDFLWPYRVYGDSEYNYLLLLYDVFQLLVLLAELWVGFIRTEFTSPIAEHLNYHSLIFNFCNFL